MQVLAEDFLKFRIAMYWSFCDSTRKLNKEDIGCNNLNCSHSEKDIALYKDQGHIEELYWIGIWAAAMGLFGPAQAQ